MSNYVANIVSFEGDQEIIKEMLLAVQNDEYGPGSISFNKIIPMPRNVTLSAAGAKLTRKLSATFRNMALPTVTIGAGNTETPSGMLAATRKAGTTANVINSLF